MLTGAKMKTCREFILFILLAAFANISMAAGNDAIILIPFLFFVLLSVIMALLFSIVYYKGSLGKKLLLLTSVIVTPILLLYALDFVVKIDSLVVVIIFALLTIVSPFLLFFGFKRFVKKTSTNE